MCSSLGFEVSAFVAFQVSMPRDPSEGESCTRVASLYCMQAVEQLVDQIVSWVGFAIAYSEQGCRGVSCTGGKVEAEEVEKEVGGK